jgi:hypothetical protein
MAGLHPPCTVPEIRGSVPIGVDGKATRTTGETGLRRAIQFVDVTADRTTRETSCAGPPGPAAPGPAARPQARPCRPPNAGPFLNRDSSGASSGHRRCRWRTLWTALPPYLAPGSKRKGMWSGPRYRQHRRRFRTSPVRQRLHLSMQTLNHSKQELPGDSGRKRKLSTRRLEMLGFSALKAFGQEGLEKPEKALIGTARYSHGDSV